MFAKIRAVVHGIPRGKVATYGDVAKAAGFGGAARQVVWALHAAPPGLPWHRVLGANGRILLKGEHGLEQRLRLQSEGVRFSGGVVAVEEHQHRFRGAKKSRSAK
jgi:methylated-DNA-protein-cysteine methyltransferase-like protein